MKKLLNLEHFPTLGAYLILGERMEQIYKHGWNENDKTYKNGQLISAAEFCLNPEPNEWDLWPDTWDNFYKEKIINKDRIGQLAVAGAFIAAEIDRLLNLRNDGS